MENNKNTFDSILGFLGVLSLLIIVHDVYNALKTDTETNVISDDALKAIQNPETADKLREAVDDYHDTGEWSKTKLESIL
ncbi:hypothetical protein SY27_12590 [Flavobacterium sp. 316]|uniref:hypothetical protein n=1 Tax=Flavobacterium sp. 316 TaxID=1603293 RepID=UPI0005E71F3E|nr:hypothetical protein [Flavobacterium sp. 316]KIX20721.1 hypothetical protein SY27_12590 [Flavobacterium sp. 316]